MSAKKKDKYRSYEEGYEQIFGKTRIKEDAPMKHFDSTVIPEGSYTTVVSSTTEQKPSKVARLPYEPDAKVQERVANSALILDYHFNKWYEQIDVKKFMEMTGDDYSVFDQLFPRVELWLKFIKSTLVDMDDLLAGFNGKGEAENYDIDFSWLLEIFDRKHGVVWREKYLDYIPVLKQE